MTAERVEIVVEDEAVELTVVMLTACEIEVDL